mmetsp:Transcript_23905/g.56473  ORF Transcript_23905/g.56473 Transcript_23905/m.56473 type:complete len:238 (-) Transcript_23905:334-1047(-)
MAPGAIIHLGGPPPAPAGMSSGGPPPPLPPVAVPGGGPPADGVPSSPPPVVEAGGAAAASHPTSGMNIPPAKLTHAFDNWAQSLSGDTIIAAASTPPTAVLKVMHHPPIPPSGVGQPSIVADNVESASAAHRSCIAAGVQTLASPRNSTHDGPVNWFVNEHDPATLAGTPSPCCIRRRTPPDFVEEEDVVAASFVAVAITSASPISLAACSGPFETHSAACGHRKLGANFSMTARPG